MDAVSPAEAKAKVAPREYMSPVCSELLLAACGNICENCEVSERQLTSHEGDGGRAMPQVPRGRPR
jgi:hypothetical protein